MLSGRDAQVTSVEAFVACISVLCMASRRLAIWHSAEVSSVSEAEEIQRPNGVFRDQINYRQTKYLLEKLNKGYSPFEHLIGGTDP